MDNTQDIFDNQEADGGIPFEPCAGEGCEESGTDGAPDRDTELNSLREEVRMLRASLDELLAAERRREVNSKNAQASSGRIGGGGNEYFTPDEVRAMSGAEVRDNYKKIRASMEKWS